jgi:CubicO group peptidase (beta-lactamase class C family)
MAFLKQITLVCFISACFFSCKKDAKQSETNPFETYVALLQDRGITTGNILVYQDGEIIYENSNGLRSINPKDSLTLDSQFRLASVSKQFTGMAIMKLKEAGKLDYDQKVNTIITDFPYDNITVRHLLNHVSGLTDYERLIDENWTPEDPNKKHILGNDEIIKEFHSVSPELDFQPGEKWEYSNTGYLYLASIVEKISGQHFNEFAKENIFDPLKMNNTTLYKYQIEADPNMPNRVYGYEIALNQVDLKPNDYNIVNDVRGDGGLYSTLEDLYKWNQALVNHTIIPKSYLEEAWTPAKLNNGDLTDYGFGWFIESKENEPKVVAHSGGWVGFVTYVHNEVDANSGFILLTNNSGDSFGDVYGGISNIMKGKPYDMPKKILVKEVANKILTEDVDKGLAHYHKFKKDTINYSVNEGQVNMLAYRLMNEEHLDDALHVFKLNIDEHPNSANPYDSYGDALLIKGDTINALKNFKRCFELDSTLNFTYDKVIKLEAALNIE